MEKNTYTIFGHTGFIGSHLKKKLKNKNLILPKKGQFFFKKNLGNVIYCIGSDDWKNDVINSYYANLGFIPEIIKNNKFVSFTYLSSIRIYKKNSSEEKDVIVNPNNLNDYYNIKKICAESFLLSQNKKIKIIRLSNIYGDNFYSPILLPTLIREALKFKKILININKYSLKNYLGIEDATNIILKIIRRGKKKIYNVSSGKRISIISIANTIQKITNCKIILRNQNIINNEPLIKINKIKKEFKFKISSNLLKNIKHLVKQFKTELKLL